MSGTTGKEWSESAGEVRGAVAVRGGIERGRPLAQHMVVSVTPLDEEQERRVKMSLSGRERAGAFEVALSVVVAISEEPS